MTRKSIVTAAFIIVACADPTAPVRGPAVTGVTGPFVELGAPPTLILVAPGQLVTLELASGETKPAWFQAEIFVRDGSATGGPAQMDGAILVVSAADGPMPQSSPNAETLSIDVKSAALGPAGVVRFEGVATRTDPSGRRTTFDFSGSLTPTSTCCSGSDWLTYDFQGGAADGDYNLQAVLRLAPAK